MDANAVGDLYAKRDENEMFWVARQPHLKKLGYDLRPRYQPDWQPSWKGHPEGCLDAEDGVPLTVGHFTTQAWQEKMLIHFHSADSMLSTPSD